MKKIIYEVAKKRFLEQGRIDIELCVEEYLTWKKKAKFYDKVEQDYFWAIPKNVYVQNSCHPNRAKKMRAETNIKKYGNACSLHGEVPKKKTKKTWQEKYGKNISNPFQAQEIKNKSKKTCQKKYGVDNISQTKERKKQLSNRFIKETGEHLQDWLGNQKEPKPSYFILLRFFNNDTISLKEVVDFVENWQNNKTSLEVIAEKLLNVKHYNRKPKQITETYKPDFKLTDNVFVNVDGLYWHSEKVQLNNRYHFNIRNHFEENNLRIIQFREDEIKNKPEICKSIVNNAVGKTTNKIFARKCKIKIVPHKEAKNFLEDNHLMGSTTAKHVGLYFKDNLVSLISYKEKKCVCKIERFCSLVDYNIVGGFSKLLSYLEKHCLKSTTTEIHNWVDLRYGTGAHLLNKGFVQKKDVLGWKWTDYKNTFNRLKCRANMDNRKLTQQQHADELGWFKIYDAGQRNYIKYLLH